MKPLISVVVCTHNRVDFLINSLNGIIKQSLPVEKFEILIVDNASTDKTQEVINLKLTEVMNLRYLHEPELGLNHARNTGWKKSIGDYVTYLDDDAIPDKHWLFNIYQFILDHPNVIIVGGTVLPVWSVEPPSWLGKDLYPYLSICDYIGDDNGFILDFPIQYPVGANITFSRSVLKKMRGFKKQLDRKGNILLSGGETELNYRIQKENYPTWFCPKAIVYHHIPPKRCSKKYFRSISYWAGRSAALVDHEVFQKNYHIVIIRRILSRLSKNLIRSIIFCLFVRKNSFELEIYIREVIGYIHQGFRILLKNHEVSQINSKLPL